MNDTHIFLIDIASKLKVKGLYPTKSIFLTEKLIWFHFLEFLWGQMHPAPYKTLWSDTRRSRFFLIPDDRELSRGNFELRTVTGRQRTADEANLEPFEVSQEEAKVWLKEQFSQMLTSAKTSIMDALKNWRSLFYSQMESNIVKLKIIV